MRFAVESPGLGTYADDPNRLVELAVTAEATGWDGFFLWDHLNEPGWATRVVDPWSVLAAVAVRTERLRLGTTVTPVPRHHPFALARTLTTIDRLSGGRVIFGAGLGAGGGRDEAVATDATLAKLGAWMAGEEVDGSVLGPLPLQRPRVPIWIGGASAPALRRAARWDGWTISSVGADGGVTLTPGQLSRQIERIGAPIDIAATGVSEPGRWSLAEEYADAGATWWLETCHDLRAPYDVLLARVAAGPPGQLTSPATQSR